MSAFIDTILSPVVGFLLEWSLRWLVVSALPILWLWLRPPRDARFCYQICLATIAAGLLLPVLPRWGGLVPAQPTPATAQHVVLEAESPTQVSAVPPRTAPQIPNEPAPARIKEVVVPPEPTNSYELPVSESIGWRPSLIRGVTFVTTIAWLVGMLIHLARWIAGSLYLRQLRRTAWDSDAGTIELLVTCRRELLVARRVRLAVHPAVSSPLLLGPRRLAILLPCSWSQLSQTLQRASLLHELAHVVRCDDWIALATRMVDLALFFHPCYRWLRSRLECEREICCDDLALASGVEPHGYAQLLRDFASQPSRFRSTSPAIPFGQGSTVKSRIHHILENNMLPKTNSSRWIWYSVALVLAISVPVASLRIHAVASASETLPGAQALDEKETRQPAASLVSKDQLMFGSKTFPQWQAILRADLKPEVRAEAFQALSTFGKNGYADEAVKAILEIAKTYDPVANDQGDQRVIRAASNELRRLGPAVLPALEQELQHGKPNGRRFSALVFRQMGDVAKPAVPMLERALKDEDAYVRGEVALSLANCSALKDPAGLKALLAVVASGVKVSNQLFSGSAQGDAVDALTELMRQGEAARPILPDLVSLLVKNPGNWKQPGFPNDLAQRIVAAASRIGGDSKTMLPVYEYQIRYGIRYPEGALDKLAAMGPEARSAVPLLVQRFRETGSQAEKHQYVEALFKIDAEPRELVPVVKDYLEKSKAFSKGAGFSPPLTAEGAKRYRDYLEKHDRDLP
jgi:beta-lactamase regulating signal transducer with metallopeptidase domain